MGAMRFEISVENSQKISCETDGVSLALGRFIYDVNLNLAIVFVVLLGQMIFGWFPVSFLPEIYPCALAADPSLLLPSIIFVFVSVSLQFSRNAKLSVPSLHCLFRLRSDKIIAIPSEVSYQFHSFFCYVS